MLLTNRRFQREPPSRIAKSIYIFCEGAKREFQYFEYFKEKDSRINVEVYKLHPHEDNSPMGLLKIAKNCIIATEDNPKPKYTFQENDEVWFVLDTDPDKNESRKPQIEYLLKETDKLSDWFVVQSNPCFEVWLFYHLHSDKPSFKGEEYCIAWKKIVNNSIKGGFDSRRHPIYIENASINAENNFKSLNNLPSVGSTDVYKLGNSIYALLKLKIDKVLQDLNNINNTEIEI